MVSPRTNFLFLSGTQVFTTLYVYRFMEFESFRQSSLYFVTKVGYYGFVSENLFFISK